MITLGAKDLATRSDEILRMVREGETVEIVDEGQVVARVVPPVEDEQHDKDDGATFFAALERVAKEISSHITEPIDAVEIVREGRRGY